MFPPAREVLKSREGLLSETPFALLLHRIFVEERTVVLELRRHQLEKRISFEEGVPVGCRSNLLHETLGRFLVDRGRISDTQCHDALAQAARDGEPLGEVLVKRALLTPYDLFRAMQQNVARKILDCFTWTDGRFRFHGVPAREETPLRMNPAQLILTAATTVLPFDVVAQGLTFFDGQHFARVAKPPHSPDALKLHPKDAKVLAVLQRRPTFEQLCTHGALTSEEAMRRLYAFGMLGIVDFAEAVAPAEPPPPAPQPLSIPLPAALQAAPAPVEPASTESTLPPSDADSSRRANEVLDAFLKHRMQDPFDLLGVAPTAPLPEIRRRYVAFAERFRPAAFTGELASIADKAEELFLAGARAYATLADYESRNLATERRSRRAEEAKRPKRDAGADFRIETGLLDATEQYREGLRRIELQDWPAAVRYLEFACDIDPTRAAYRAQLGWARFRDSPSRAQNALSELQQAVRADPRCHLAHYFEGQIRAETGDLAGAEDAFRRAVKASPEEKKYTEALKSVGLARRRGA